MITVPHLHCTGSLTSTPTLAPGLASLSDRHVAPNAAIARTKHALTHVLYTIPLTSLRVWNDAALLLPTTPSSDDLSLGEGAGTGFVADGPSLSVSTGDLQTTTGTRYCQGTFELPPEYVDSGDVMFRVFCGTAGTALVTSEIDLNVFESNNEGGIGADLCVSPKQTCNTTHRNVDFDITDSGLVAGDILSFRIELDVDDTSGSSGAVKAQITRIGVLCAIRG